VDGAEALSAMRAEPPALVLLDVSMPGLSGLDVLRAAGADAALARVPIVMFSGNQDPRTRDEAMRLGARGFLVKGLDWPESLWQVVEQFLGRQVSGTRYG
jgi:CheY-like chemotaxis protein